MSRPRYPKRRRPHWLSITLGACALLLALFFGQHFLGNDADEKPLVMNHSPVPSLSSKEAYPEGPLPDSLVFDALQLEKSKRLLTAYAKGKPVRVYLVALGFTPKGHKQFEGDGRTPEGTYTIDDKNPRSAYYKNLGISYPNEMDSAFASAQGKSPGGDIKIHGLAPHFAELGDEHRLTDWTYGCIAVTNPEMEELYARTPRGVPIQILP